MIQHFLVSILVVLQTRVQASPLEYLVSRPQEKSEARKFEGGVDIQQLHESGVDIHQLHEDPPQFLRKGQCLF
jgi:hypothetical protein